MRSDRASAGAVVVLTLGVLAVSLSGCASTRRSLGMTKVTPDEFRVVTKAPLVIPPDYALRPPAPGQPRPEELQPESQARQALLGARLAEERSDGEKLLASKAGADRADPLARYAVDDQFGDVSYKEKSFADKVMFWKKGDSATIVSKQSGESAPIDADAENKRLATLTGGKPVVVPLQQPKTKLPGL